MPNVLQYPVEKECTKCRVVKPRSAFYPDRASSPNSIKPLCRVCSNAQSATNARKNATYLKRRYGIDLAQYEQMLAAQGGVCAICKNLPDDAVRFHVDHCHRCGSLRGLLCLHCNSALGSFRDDTRIMRNAVSYLESFLCA